MKAEQRMLERQETEKSTWMEVEFLLNATNQVIDCRRVSSTPTIGYYLTTRVQRRHSSSTTGDVEKHTEKLHGLTSPTWTSWTAAR